MMGSINFLQRSVQYKIILSLIVIVTGIVGAFGSYEYSQERYAHMMELEQLSEEKVTRLAENLVFPLWEVDSKWAEDVILAEMLDFRVYSISIEGEGGLGVAKVRNDHWQIVDGLEKVTGDFLIYERDVVRAEETIGSVKLFISKKFMAAELRKSVFNKFLSTAVLIVLVSLALLIMLERVIIQPLKKLLEASHAISGGDYSRSIDITSKDEIGMLSEGFNTMEVNIQQREKELSSALLELENKSVKIHQANAQLEQDIADLLQAEETLNKWHHIFLNAGWGVAAGFDTLEMMNPEFARMHGYEIEELIGQPLSVVFSPTARKMLPDHIKRVHEEGQLTFQAEHIRKDGSTFPVEMNATAVKDDDGNVLYRVVNILDITERTRLQAMMVQTEKMLSVGGLAAGMAHEINNPLSAILQSMQNVRRRLSGDMPANLKAASELGIDFDKLQDYLRQRRIPDFFDAISESGQRASTIVVNMLGFSRSSGTDMAPVDVPEMIDQALKMAAMDYDLKKKYDFKNVDVRREYAPDLSTVPCVHSEIQQVLLNLFTNAAHAFQAAGNVIDDPQITLRTAHDGDMAMIEVADNGPGMSEEVRERVFEPFFTTKPPGKGTGLGLSVAYYIVCDEHHGRMEVISAPGQGASFKIWLPLKQEKD